MTLDISTLALLLSLTNLLQVIALLAQSWLDQTHRGPGWWTLGSAVVALGFLAAYLRAVPPLASLAIVANNLLFVYGEALLYVGLLRFFARRERRRPLLAFLAVYTLVDIYLTYVSDNIVLRRAVLYMAIATLAFLAARALFVFKTRSVTGSAHLLATVFLAQGSVFVVSTVLDVTRPPDASLLAASLVQVTTFLSALIVTTLLTFGFILLVNQRLSVESREAHKRLELILNTSPDAVLLTRLDDGAFVDISDGFTALTGYTRADVAGKSSLDINLWHDPADREKLVALLRDQGACENLEIAVQRKDGRRLIGMVSAKVFALEGQPHLLSVTRDITERKRLQGELEQQATTDELTGIFNRRHFLVLAQRELKRALRLKHPLALVVVDVDHLKVINDTRGHAAGDQALIAFTQICQKNIREIDVFARFGGDEFALLLPDVTREQAQVVVERVRLALAARPLAFGGEPFSLTVSAGLAGLVDFAGRADPAPSLDTLLGRADQALYQAKELGRNRVIADSDDQ